MMRCSAPAAPYIKPPRKFVTDAAEMLNEIILLSSRLELLVVSAKVSDTAKSAPSNKEELASGAPQHSDKVALT